jgi:hypothetical protein
MSDPETDRVAVPTNGRAPHPAPSMEPLRGEPPTPGGVPLETSDQDFAVAFSPKQLAIGFGIIASLLLLIAGRNHRNRSGR